MTKKDFNLIANAIAAQRARVIGSCTSIQVNLALDDLSRWFATDLAWANPRFQRERFLRACGCGAWS